jgi:hypothetical protein
MPDPVATPSTPASGGAPAAAALAAAEPRPIEVSNSEKTALAMRLEADHGGAKQALFVTAGKVIRYQKRAQEAERQSAALRELLPPKDAVVLTGDQAKAVQALLDKKVDLATLPATLENAQKELAISAARVREADLTKAAGSKYVLPVLKNLVGDKAIVFKDMPVKQEDGTTKVEPVAFIKVDDKTEVLLDTWAELPDQKAWHPVLLTEHNPTTDSTDSSTATSAGGSMPKQTSAGSRPATPAAKDSIKAVDSVMNAMYQTPGQRAAAAAAANGKA